MVLKDEVPVTGALLSLVCLLHNARKQFINESHLAEELGLEKPKEYWQRCEELFFKRFAHEVRLIGLAANQQTFEAIMRMSVSDELMRTDYAELPKKFVFDPWLGMGYGGIKRLADSLWGVTLKLEGGAEFSWTGDAEAKEHAEGQAIAEAVAQTGKQVYEVVSITAPKA